MLQKLNNNKIFSDILSLRLDKESKLNAILVYFSRRQELTKSIFLGLDVSENTKKDYQARIVKFLTYLNQNDDKVDTNVFYNYKNYLMSLDLEMATKNKYLVVAKVFIKELARQQLIEDITLNVKLFKIGNEHKKSGHRPIEIKKINSYLENRLKSIENNNIDSKSKISLEIHRLWAIFILACMNGLRQIEIARIDYNDIDFSNQSIKILGKGRQSKENVYLSQKTIHVLKTYIKNWDICSGPLFFSTSNQNKGKRLSTRSLQRLYKKLILISGIETNATLHGLRHFYTTEMIKKNIPLNHVQKMTRHKSLNMLQVYNDEVWKSENSNKIHDEVFSSYY